MNNNLIAVSKLKCLLFILFIYLHPIFLTGSEIDTLSHESEISAGENVGNNNSHLRPEGASPLPVKNNIFFDLFKKEVTIDKYVTKDGKKVKVKLVRKRIPIFNMIARWYNKKKAKRKAKKKAKRQKKKPLKKRRGILNRFRKKKSKKSEDMVQESLENKSEELTNELDATGVFEEGSVPSDSENQQANPSSTKISSFEDSGDQSSSSKVSDYKESVTGYYTSNDDTSL
ncbi:hypothetical protein FG386_002681 [Cryptosporidium ryanae]|uniref:uncharacterized protein n=1 Tax=Cryptosporidium ryanae TaxID=515981 RepID=UPI00351A99C9|nr:hypothetical protein FG386_002681 [Cryptosporidium ryanae]